MIHDQLNQKVGSNRNKRYRYQAFGLAIDSDIELFQLLTKKEKSPHDVIIVRGSVPADGIDKSQSKEAHCQVNKNTFWLNIPDVARFMISNGNKITVDIHPEAEQQTVNLYLLGSCLGALLQQRGDLVLHGNAVQIGDEAVIVVAQSGVGKSTLAAEFLRRGYSLLADDVCAIDLHGSVQPSYPYLKLWQDTIGELEFDQSKLTQIRLQKEKFYYPLDSAFCRTSLPVSAVYVLNKKPIDRTNLMPIKGLGKLRALLNNKYRPKYATKMNLAHKHVTRIIKMLEDIKVSRIIRPESGFRIEELAQMIIDDFASDKK